MRPRKDMLDKAAWAWAETTEPSAVSKEHIFKAYRIDLPECGTTSCKRNCRGSPRCLSGLGEQRWILDQRKDGTEDTEDDPNSERRDAGSFIGLKNLGATCYVNSLLQLWFHNLPFRKAIYEWNPLDDPEEKECLREDESKYPVTAVGRLQVLFAELQFGIRRFIDPVDFINSLGLDTSQQQDAQEFSKLFLSMLEDRLATQTKPSVHDMISKNFQGEYSYVTKCSTCLTESDRVAKFYELDLNIQGHRTLGDSLAEFLHQEKLEGANRYHCGVCREKQDATRCIRLRSLPPVLHLQLLRFVYDRSKGHKKKLSSPIHFPEVLDMSEYLGKPAGSMVYNVSAILAHMGTSAHSGHYVANIKDSVTGVWHRFNDENVENEDGRKLSLGTDDDAYESSSKVKGRTGRPAKGHLISRNAYMLVYSLAVEGSSTAQSPARETVSHFNGRQDMNGTAGKGESCEIDSDTLHAEMVSWGLQERLRNKVDEHNKQFEEWASSELDKRVKVKEKSENLKVEMHRICQSLRTGTNLEGAHFISTAWLHDFILKGMGDAAVGEINNHEETCPHECVDPSKVTNMKIIHAAVAKMLYDKYGGSPRFEVPQALCKKCVVNKCKEIRLKNKIISDTKEIAALSKYRMDETDPGYWVGKDSFKHWKNLVLRPLLADAAANKEKKSGDAVERSFANLEKHVCEKHAETELDKGGNTNTSIKKSSLPTGSAIVKEESTPSPASPRKRTFPTRSKAVSSSAPAKKICKSGNSVENGNCLNETDTSNSKSHNTELMLPGSSNMFDEITCGESSNCQEDARDEDGAFGNGKENSNNIEDYAGDLGFNEDIICEHGNLSIDESKRRLVVPEIWTIFRTYFPTSKEFPRNSSVCPSCQEEASVGEQLKESHRRSAVKQKEALSDVYHWKRRPVPPELRKTKPSYGSTLKDKETYFLVSETFLHDWKLFICARAEPPLCVRNEDLLCQHQRLLFRPLVSHPETADLERSMLLYPEEWNELKNFYSIDHEITVTFDLVNNKVLSDPEVCLECEQSREREDQIRRCTYNSAKIYVRRVHEDKDITCPLLVDHEDPEYANPVATTTALQNLVGISIRRSERSRRPRGDSKELTVSSTQTLQQLKRQIYRLFSVLPMDQHLSIDGRELVGPDETLGALNVLPSAQLLLKADEPTEGASIMDDYVKEGAIEEGFKGTGLLSR